MPRSGSLRGKNNPSAPQYVVEIESSTEQPEAKKTNPRWLIAIGVVAVVALGAIIALPGVESQREASPPTTVPDSGPPMTVWPIQPDAMQVPATDSEVIAIRLLTDPETLAAPFSLVELSEMTNGEHSVRLVDLEGQATSANNPVVLGPNQWPAWPGATTRPFLVAASTVVYPSRGEVVAIDIDTGESMIVGPGLTVLDGLSVDEFWVVEAGERSVVRHRLAAGADGERFDFAGNGRALTAAGEGLVVAPPIGSGFGRLAHWSPDNGLRSIPVPDGFELVGGTDEAVMLTSTDAVMSYNLETGEFQEVPMDGQPDAQRGALSPDGSLLALAQRHALTSLGRITIIDTVTGEQRGMLADVVDREFAWTSNETLVTVGYDGTEFQVIEFNVDTDKRTAVAAVTYPWIYVAVATNS